MGKASEKCTEAKADGGKNKTLTLIECRVNPTKKNNYSLVRIFLKVVHIFIFNSSRQRPQEDQPSQAEDQGHDVFVAESGQITFSFCSITTNFIFHTLSQTSRIPS